MKPTLNALKAIQNAVTTKQIVAALETVEQEPSALLAKQLNEDSRKRGTRTVLAVIAVLLIIAVTTLAYIGGGFIAEHANVVALVFGVFDLVIVWLLFANLIPGKWRFGAVAVELLSLAYLGYAITGFFGGGNLRTAAEKKIVASYEVAKNHYTMAQSTADLFTRTVKNAASVAEIELRRDGKGVVYEKASLVANMKADSIKAPADLPSVPEFTSLTQANKWLQTEREKVANAIAKYDAAVEAMKQQASATEQSLNEAMKLGLSQQQLSNLQVLAASVRTIAEKRTPETKISDEVLKPGDLKADGFQMFIGYIIDGVIVALILFIALQKSSEKKIEEIREHEMKALIEYTLSEEGINYDSEMIKDVPVAKQYEILKLVESLGLLPFLKEKANFSELVLFEKDYPQLARKLKGSQWTLSDIRKDLMKKPEFAGYAEQIIQLTPSDWQLLKKVIANPEDLFQMEEEDKTKFLKLLKQVKSKTSLKDDQLKEFFGKFLFEQDLNSEFLKTLEACVTNIQGGQILAKLNPNFVRVSNPDVAKFVCHLMDDSNKFARITSGWTTQLNDSMNDILANGIKEEPQFDSFMEIVFGSGGIEGVRKMLRTYVDKKKEAESTSIGKKKLVLKPDLVGIKQALQSSNDALFLQNLGDAFVVEHA